MAMGRSQKYHPRKRTLYALLFPNGHCYIGQTADPKQREQQHRRPTGGWNRPFDFQVLGEMVGTETQAADYECAWRLCAQASGWRIYGKPPGIVVNPRRVANGTHNRLARTLRWPLETAQKTMSWWPWVIGALLQVAAWLTLA